MRKHHYVIADKSRFAVFCTAVLLACMVTGYLAGAAITVNNVQRKTDVVYYAPAHFNNQRGK